MWLIRVAYLALTDLHPPLFADVYADESGERLGEQVWDEEMLKETRGIFLIMGVRCCPTSC